MTQEKVLVVENNLAVMILIKTILEDNYEVCTATGYREFISAIEAEKPDAVITDLGLDNGSGIDVYTWLQEKNYEIPVVLMSGERNSLQDIQRSNRYNFVAYLQKPFDYNGLLYVVELAISKAR
jgi:DNA-binding NtrC family response regulator